MTDSEPAAPSPPAPPAPADKADPIAPRAPVVYYVRHLTRYRYGQPVTLSHHAAHLMPRSLDRQTCLATQVTVNPPPATRSERVDYFGNLASLFTIEQTHSELVVTAESRVRVTPPPLPPLDASPPWEAMAVRLAAASDPEALDAAEFIQPSPLVPRVAGLAELAAPSFPPGRPLLAAVLDLTRRIHAGFAYDPAATDLATPLAEVLAQRRGVCQDFAHVQIGALRALGLAARYVSGYILTDGGLTGADASHAWLAVWCPGCGWVDFDPTNDCLVGNEHVTVAWGRDFDDVSPLKGMVVGGADHTLEVAVKVAPERRAAPERPPGSSIPGSAIPGAAIPGTAIGRP